MSAFKPFYHHQQPGRGCSMSEKLKKIIVSLRRTIFFQTKRWWCVCHQPMKAFAFLGLNVKRFFLLINRQTFLSNFVMKELVHVVCTYTYTSTRGELIKTAGNFPRAPLLDLRTLSIELVLKFRSSNYHVNFKYSFILKWVISPTWGSPPPCKQALIFLLSHSRLKARIRGASSEAACNEDGSD